MDSRKILGSGHKAEASSSKAHGKDLGARECPNPPLNLTKRPVPNPDGGRREGKPVNLLCNYFRVDYQNIPDAFQYDVKISRITCGSSNPMYFTNKTLSYIIMDKVKHFHQFNNTVSAFDGENSMFTVGELTETKMDFTVEVDDVKGSRYEGEGSSKDIEQTTKKLRLNMGKVRKFKVDISYVGRVTMRTLQDVLMAVVDHNTQSALRVLDIVLRQHAWRRECILVNQRFFNWKVADLTDLGGGVTGCPGYHVSFKLTQNGLSLNMDAATTTLLKASPVLPFLLETQGVKNSDRINWDKAKGVLKGVRIKTTHTNRNFKITGLTAEPCRHLRFLLKQKGGGHQDSEPQMVTVLEYFREKGFDLESTAHLPCIDVGTKERPNYLPMQLCTILPGQRYKNSLSGAQRLRLIDPYKQGPAQQMQMLESNMEKNNYNSDPVLSRSEINVDKRLGQITGRVLPPPELRFGQQRDQRFVQETPTDGQWNFNKKTMFNAAKIGKWVTVNFSRIFSKDDVSRIARDLQRCCNSKGMEMSECSKIMEEREEDRNKSPVQRVEAMRDLIIAEYPNVEDRPKFLLCILPEKKSCDLYGPWKKLFLLIGVVNQCISPNEGRISDQYFTNVAMKINAKMNGLNSVVNMEVDRQVLPIISLTPTIIFGMEVLRGPPRNLDIPSIASVVSSRKWPMMSSYRASIRTQTPRTQIFEVLHNPTPTPKGELDMGIINELLLDFYDATGHRKPEQMIIFREGVSESQFDRVLNDELKEILKACEFIEDNYGPRVTLIIAQKKHHTKLFLPSERNVAPGTVVDSSICHPRNFDFFLCPHKGQLGTSRPTHYHVLHDENNFTVDQLQRLVHALSYVFQRSTTAISTVAPINYAHLAATQMQQFLQGEAREAWNIDGIPVPHRNVRDTMFFC